MTSHSSFKSEEFDKGAQDYDAALAQGISLSGKGKNYFARGRVMWMADLLRQLEEKPKSIMNFGCGVGSATHFLLELIRAESILGVNMSAKSLDVAKQKYSLERT